MQVSCHLTFRGQCEEAFRFYQRCLGGTVVTMLTYGASPMAEQVPAEWRGKVVHASLKVAGVMLTGADLLPQQYVQPRGFFVLLSVDAPADAERVFQSLAENGEVLVAIQKTFWSSRFGVLVDRFGIPWEINCEQAPGAA